MSTEPLRLLIPSAASTLLAFRSAVVLLMACARVLTCVCKLATVLWSSAIVAASFIRPAG